MSLTLADVGVATLLAIVLGVITSWLTNAFTPSTRRVAVVLGLAFGLAAASAYIKVQLTPPEHLGGGDSPLARPKVSLTQITKAASLDPHRPQGAGTPGCTASVETFENGLAVLGLLNRRWVDGSYGTATLAAVKRFQQNIGDRADGVPGPLELKSLALRSGTFQPAP